jgi:phosphoribosylanthranilate isomerase
MASSPSESPAAAPTTTTFRAIGFCGVDDSVDDPIQLIQLAQQYRSVEFGVLFRPDQEGQPRYASLAWVERLVACIQCHQKESSSAPVKLAAHLCGIRVNQVLEATSEGLAFLQQLQDWGFQRVQINATQVNGVDTSQLASVHTSFLAVVGQFPNLEFIIQKNEETRPLWEGLLQHFHSHGNKLPPSNISMLLDESKGTGVLPTSWPSPPSDYEKIGYAGGIGPDNIRTVIRAIQAAAPGRRVWIDMESSLRTTKDGRDVFDLDKCRRVIEAAVELGIM